MPIVFQIVFSIFAVFLDNLLNIKCNYIMKDLVKVFKVSVKSFDGAPLSWSRHDVYFKSFDSAVYDVDTTYAELVNNLSYGFGDELIYENKFEYEHGGYLRQACVRLSGRLVLLNVETCPFLLVLREHYKSSSHDSD